MAVRQVSIGAAAITQGRPVHIWMGPVVNFQGELGCVRVFGSLLSFSVRCFISSYSGVRLHLPKVYGLPCLCLGLDVSADMREEFPVLVHPGVVRVLQDSVDLV